MMLQRAEHITQACKFIIKFGGKRMDFSGRNVDAWSRHFYLPACCHSGGFRLSRLCPGQSWPRAVSLLAPGVAWKETSCSLLSSTSVTGMCCGDRVACGPPQLTLLDFRIGYQKRDSSYAEILQTLWCMSERVCLYIDIGVWYTPLPQVCQKPP